jgi:hypothetical protein
MRGQIDGSTRFQVDFTAKAPARTRAAAETPVSAPAIPEEGRSFIYPRLYLRRFHNGIRRLLCQVSQEADNQERHCREDGKRSANGQGHLSRMRDESESIPAKQGGGIESGFRTAIPHESEPATPRGAWTAGEIIALMG